MVRVAAVDEWLTGIVLALRWVTGIGPVSRIGYCDVHGVDRVSEILGQPMHSQWSPGPRPDVCWLVPLTGGLAP